MPIKKNNINDLNDLNKIKKIQTRCPHVVLIDKLIFKTQNFEQSLDDLKCNLCQETTNLWYCLHDNCKHVYCSNKNQNDQISHKKQHFDSKNHSIMFDLNKKSIFCDLCLENIDLNNNEPSINDLYRLNNLNIDENMDTIDLDNDINNLCDNSQFSDCLKKNLTVYVNNYGQRENNDDDDDDDNDDDSSFGLNSNNNDSNNDLTRGLVGLRNLGNTCYLNAALQALSNCPSMTNFFLECQYYVKCDRIPCVSKHYMKLMQTIWSTTNLNTSIAPIEVVQTIKYLNPMFKGYLQQDSQEFLLCLLDQLNEELKRVKISTNNDNNSRSSSSSSSSSSPTINNNLYKNSNDDVNMSSQSDTDSFKSCGSSLSTSENNFLSHYETTINGDGPTILFSNERIHQKQNFNNDILINNDNHDSGCYSSSSTATTTTTLNSLKKSTNNVNNNNELILDPILLENVNNKKFKNSITDETNEDRMEDDKGDDENDDENENKDKNNNKKDIKKQYSSIISDVFDGKMISQVQCIGCDTISNTIETFQDLSLPIPTKEYLQALENKLMVKKDSSKQYQTWSSWLMSFIKGSFIWGPTIKLEDCLTVYFSEADLKGDNMYSCEKCKALREGIKYSKILKLPETLCIHLKRFRHDYMFSTKISTYVDFPLKDLDMNLFLHKNCKNKSSKYDLCAIICHHGHSSGGHYTCYAYNHIDNEWYEYDDSYCTRVDESTVKNSQAYVLFYRKKNPQMDAVYNELNYQLNQKSIKTKPYYISKQWINKLKYFSEPGPISNHDFLCSHGAVYPEYWSNIDKLVIPVNETIYNYLLERFGIDDINMTQCNLLYPCKQCLIDNELLNQRRYNEKFEFKRLNEITNINKNTNSYFIVYAISPNWIKEWESFVHGKSKDIPGPINNYSICTKNKNGTFDLNKNGNYFEINKLCWDFLYKSYGGGPVLIKNIINNKPMNTKIQAIPIQTTTTTTPQSVIKTLSKSISLSSSPTTQSSFSPPKLTTSKSVLYTNTLNNNLNLDNNSTSSQTQIIDINQITSQNIFNVDTTNTNENILQLKQTKI